MLTLRSAVICVLIAYTYENHARIRWTGLNRTISVATVLYVLVNSDSNVYLRDILIDNAANSKATPNTYFFGMHRTFLDPMRLSRKEWLILHKMIFRWKLASDTISCRANSTNSHVYLTKKKNFSGYGMDAVALCRNIYFSQGCSLLK